MSSGRDSTECTPIRATRPPKRGQRLSLPSDPLTGAPGLHARDARSLLEQLVLDGVDVADELCRSRPRLGCAASPREESSNVTPAPSTPGIA